MTDLGLLKGAFSFYSFILATTYFVFGSLLLGLRNARVKGNEANPRLISFALNSNIQTVHLGLTPIHAFCSHQ